MIRWLTVLALSCTSVLFATDQTLLATASAGHGTLVVWEEGYTLHAGVRSSDGTWTDHALPIVPVFQAIAGSNGEEFVVVALSAYGHQLLRLDRNGGVIGTPVPVTSDPYDILWTGHEYLLVGMEQRDIVVTKVGTDGTVSAGRAINVGASQMDTGAALATNGDGYYAVWSEWHGPSSPPMPAMGVRGRRQPADLTPRDAAVDIFDLDTYMYGAAVAWDGTQYVVAWSGDAGVYTARVSAEGRVSPAQLLSDDLAWGARVQPVPGGVVIDWRTSPSSFDAGHLAFVRQDGAATPAVDLPYPIVNRNEEQRVAALADGNAALVDEAIVDGARRIRVTIISRDGLPERPGAPRAEASLEGAQVELRWTAPQQPVTGYRVEARVDNGNWTATGTVLPADQRSVMIARQGTTLALRVRAVNDAGPGAYSDPVLVHAAKRRTMR